MGPAYRVQFHGSDHIIRTASFSAFSFYIQNLAKILVELEIWIFKSDPSLVVDIFLNQDYSGDSNGGICVTIPALGDENRDLLCFVYLLFLGNPLGVQGHIIHRWKGIHE